MITSTKLYAGFTVSEPYGVALVARHFDGRVTVGGCFENQWAVKQALIELRDMLKAEHILATEISGWCENGEGWAQLAEMAWETTGICFQTVYQPISVARQALGSVIATQGPASSRFQIDTKGPGAELLAQRIDARGAGGIADAVAICCLRIEDDFPGGVARSYDAIQVESNFDVCAPERARFRGRW